MALVFSFGAYIYIGGQDKRGIFISGSFHIYFNHKPIFSFLAARPFSDFPPISSHHSLRQATPDCLEH